MRFRKQVVWRIERLHEGSLPSLGVDFDNFPPRVLVEMHLFPLFVLSPMCRIVVKANDFLLPILGLPVETRIMLERENDIFPEFEI